jgi:hypothetical protein
MLLEMLPNCFSQVFTMTFPKKSLACEGPLLAETSRWAGCILNGW